jgi:hypothetical protein
MNSTTPSNPGRSALILPAASVILCAWLATPSLVAASGNDLYARGLPLAFLIWLVALLIYFTNKALTAKPHSHFWIALALLLCVLGSISQMRVILHLSLACSIIGFCGLRFSGVLALIGAVSWLPATGWFLSHVKTGGLMGWERPLFASLLCVGVFILSHFKTQPPISIHSNS